MRFSQSVLVSICLLAGPLFAQPVFAEDGPRIDEKYQFDNLESVDRFKDWTINGWNVIDKRSLIVHTGPSRSFLLILDRDVHDLYYAESIAVSSTLSSVHAKFDTVRVMTRHGINFPARIVKIYRLQGREQTKMVREQIRPS